MSSIDKQALLKIAESVDREEWVVLDNGGDEYQVIVSGSLERGATYRSYRPVANEIPEREIAAFIAAANPSTVLALLDELEKAQRQIVNFQQSCENDPRIHEIIDLKELIAELDKRLIEYAGIATREARRVAELEKYRTAFMEWHDKTAWVQTDKRFDAIKPWGKHRADVLKEYIEHLEARQIALPQRLSPEGYHIDEAYMVDDDEGEYLDRDAVIEAISAAGIKVI
ncbi:ead/Ea22-like family protein [Salmonella enterica]|nr:ead/Ea22-like family protein [Salmonella enterica]